MLFLAAIVAVVVFLSLAKIDVADRRDDRAAAPARSVLAD